ncbi:MAG: hypothetical protein JSU70_00435 [Phycisphaerales bacterium]|nr:MAG: hypothetical protein JSU70_00435 [Phycisphaerales bacterium]
MATTCRRVKSAAAVTLIEVVVAITVLAIAALGALGYQYYAAKQARVARAQMVATKTGQLLLEDWRSTGGSEEYDPTTLGLGFLSIFIPQYFTQGQGVGLGIPLHNEAYGITIDDVPLEIVLRWYDIETDEAAQTTLRQLAVHVKFDEANEASGSLAAYNPAIVVTSYVRRDASAG